MRAAQLGHGPQHHALGGDVQAGGGLVEHQHLGPGPQRHRQRDPLHLPAGELEGFNDEWLAQYGFPTDALRDRTQTVGEVLRGKDGRLPDLVHTHPNETIAEAVALLQEYAVSDLPCPGRAADVAAEVAGSVSDRALLDALYAGTARLPTGSRTT